MTLFTDCNDILTLKEHCGYKILMCLMTKKIEGFEFLSFIIIAYFQLFRMHYH
jgi:hypothetical protein